MLARLPRWAREDYDDPYDYEEKTAQKLPGGKREIASGAFSGEYDCGNECWMIDNKRTSASSFRVRVNDFQAIETKARESFKFAGLFINFVEEGVSLAVVRERDLINLIQQNDDLIMAIESLLEGDD